MTKTVDFNKELAELKKASETTVSNQRGRQSELLEMVGKVADKMGKEDLFQELLDDYGVMTREELFNWEREKFAHSEYDSREANDVIDVAIQVGEISILDGDYLTIDPYNKVEPVGKAELSDIIDSLVD